MSLPLLRLLLLPGALALAGCAPRAGETAHVTPSAESRQASESPSLYDLTSTWTTQRGERVSLASLRGRPRAIAAIYTHCTATCPLALGELKRIASATDTSVGLVLVSLDPARDTPGALATYASGHDLDPARWTLLSGSDSDVRELAAALGLRYRRLDADAIAHANLITLLDANGVVVHQQSGFDGTADAIHIAQSLTH
jgi:protein SCO1/2